MCNTGRKRSFSFKARTGLPWMMLDFMDEDRHSNFLADLHVDTLHCNTDDSLPNTHGLQQGKGMFCKIIVL